MLQTLNNDNRSQLSSTQQLVADLADAIAPKPDKSEELEAQGWKVWLKTIFPFAFPAEFAWFHEEFWEKWWSVCVAIKAKQPVDPALQNFFLLWGRALAKSSSGTPSSLMKAAFAGRIYSIYLSETLDQAISHLANIRYLITHPDSRLAEYYPHLALEGTIPTKFGLKGKDTEGVFITKGESIFRALSIESAARGLILGGKRPDDFNIDDIDDISHSVLVSHKHLQRLTRSVLLTRDISSDLVVTTKVLQNIVVEHGVVNQIHTGKSDAFAERTTIGVVNTFEKLDTEQYIDTNGKPRHRILDTSKPSWPAVSIAKMQGVLDLIGIDAFTAECQNEFDRFRVGRVIPEYSRERQRISWSQFKAAYDIDRIPAHWHCKMALDVGYSEGQHPHWSAWAFVATAGQNSKYPGLSFVYRLCSFKNVSIDDQADSVKAQLYPEEMQMIHSWQMSHERTGEMMTLRQKHGLPFSKVRDFGKEAGIPQWRHMSRPDKSKPHPFSEDVPDGENYLLGRPMLYYIVADDQLAHPLNDAGMALLDEQVSNWDRVPVKVTETGQTADMPSKRNDDACDALRYVLALFGPQAADFTREEKVERALPDALKLTVIDTMPTQQDKDAAIMRRQIEQTRIVREMDAPVRGAAASRFARR